MPALAPAAGGMFRHSARSAFRPVPRQAGQGAFFGNQLSLDDLLLPADAGAAAAAAPALRPEAALGAAAALLDATARASWESHASPAQTPSSAERRRIQLAEKLLLVRAALQARIARQQTAAAGSSGRFSPYPPTAYSPAPFPSQAARCAAAAPWRSAMCGGPPPGAVSMQPRSMALPAFLTCLCAHPGFALPAPPPPALQPGAHRQPARCQPGGLLLPRGTGPALRTRPAGAVPRLSWRNTARHVLPSPRILRHPPLYSTPLREEREKRFLFRPTLSVRPPTRHEGTPNGPSQPDPILAARPGNCPCLPAALPSATFTSGPRHHLLYAPAACASACRPAFPAEHPAAQPFQFAPHPTPPRPTHPHPSPFSFIVFSARVLSPTDEPSLFQTITYSFSDPQPHPHPHPPCRPHLRFVAHLAPRHHSCF